MIDGKRTFDVIVGGLAFAVLSPVIGVVALVCRVVIGPPVLFRQRRIGRYGQQFDVFKFRTMTDGRDAAGRLLPDEDRLLPLGRFLRSSSLDELPELWNVVRGDMSIVGPRPLPVRYLDRYSVDERRRHDVRPGITGWAQINGRNELDWNERLAADVWYVDNRSFALDLRIIARTVLVVFGAKGISAPGEATMPELVHHHERSDA